MDSTWLTPCNQPAPLHPPNDYNEGLIPAIAKTIVLLNGTALLIDRTRLSDGRVSRLVSRPASESEGESEAPRGSPNPQDESEDDEVEPLQPIPPVQEPS